MTWEMELRRHEKESYETGKLEGKLESYRNMIASGFFTLEQVIASGQLSSEEIANLSRM